MLTRGGLATLEKSRMCMTGNTGQRMTRVELAAKGQTSQKLFLKSHLKKKNKNHDGGV